MVTTHYDSPKSLNASHAMEDYDVPRGSKRSTGYHDNTERTLTALPSQFKRGSDSSSGDSRPISLSSGSIFSADTSSGSLDSSLSGGTSGGRELPGYDVPKSAISASHASLMTSSQIRQSEVNLDDELRKIDGLMEEVVQQHQQRDKIRGIPSVTSANRVTLDGYEISGLGKHLTAGAESSLSKYNQESLSSRSSSNDTLGVWDDVSFNDEDSGGDSDELEGNVVGDGGKGVANVNEGGTMLDTWIKELESGIQGMSEVVGTASGELVSHIMYT